ncbi:ParB/RepB/Spo0J family partition protein [Arthrobacter sp. I2-34]|uniref:ParB/RepB/Spo0J family partition protein n=1 Tax=Arthrobacter hankyongi TaxID=2904801 RepID=A0ABS9LAL3_9MICC|nr:ParB/RepB/Spo0J family partition protein [Arthrobacter hankyongi]MCG2623631.1 ParB/RepB/Spo0J family partition protein [Arthrobacter hankyongi]
MSEKRRGLGRGLGALIPSTPAAATLEEDTAGDAARKTRPVDLFFPAPPSRGDGAAEEGTGSSAAHVAEVLRAPRKKAAPARRTPAKKPAAAAASRDADTEGMTAGEASVADNPPAGGGKGADGQGALDLGGIQAAEYAAEAVDSPAAADSADAADGSDIDVLMPVPGAAFAELPIELIHPNRKQPRSVFDEEDMAELVHSVREIGILQPVVVRPSSESGDHQYELVMGERRWRAAQAAGLEAVPAIIRSTADDDLLRDALLENLHRSQLNPLEEAAAYQQLLEDFGCTHDELAERIGRSRPQISNTIRLMKLPPLVQRRVAAGVLTAGHARALLGLSEVAEMEKLAQRIVAEGMSVRSTEEAVALSGGASRPARESKPKDSGRHERLDYLANSLSDRLDTNVKITLGARKGRVSIEFASVEDLNRIMDVLSPGSAN